MPIAQIKVGNRIAEFEVPAGTTPAQAEAMANQYFAQQAKQQKPQQQAKPAPQKLSADQQDVSNFYQSLHDGLPGMQDSSVLGGLKRAMDSGIHAASFHLDDTATAGLRALTTGVGRAISHGDVGEIGRTYHNAQQALQQYRGDVASEHPYEDTGGTIVGAVAAPVPGAKLLQGVAGLARYAPEALKSSELVAKASPMAAKIASLVGSPVGQAVQAGAFQGGAQAGVDTLNRSSSNYGDNILAGAEQGAMWGGGLGLAGNVLGKVGHVIADRSEGSAPRVAANKIAQMLSRAKTNIADTQGGNIPGETYTPGLAQAELATSKLMGSPSILADLSPEMQSTRAYLGRQSALPDANTAFAQSQDRAASAGDRFATSMRGFLDTGTNAFDKIKSVIAGRKAAGAADYAAGGVMDEPLAHTPLIDDAVRRAMYGDDARKAFQYAYTKMGNRDADPMAGQQPSGDTLIPNLRTWDYAKRWYDNQMNIAKRGGDNVRMQELSGDLNKIKGALIDANPKYGDILAKQRDYFQQQQSIELGQKVLDGLRNKPREFLDQISASGVKPDEVKLGLIDKLIDMNNNSDNPVALMRRMQRTPEQRQVMLQILGGQREYNVFDRMMRRELRNTNTDSLLSGKQSITGTLKQAGESLEDNNAGVSSLADSAARGAAYGGFTGFGAGIHRWYDMMKHSLGPAAQNELLKMLSGDGTDIATNIGAAEKYNARRAANTSARTRLIGKIGGALGANNVGM